MALSWPEVKRLMTVPGVNVIVAVGCTTFPGELWAAPRSWVEAAYPGLSYFNEVDKGGHFAAWEEPDLFASEVRATFRSVHQVTAPGGPPLASLGEP